jgi:hypothetical protein
MGICEFRTTHKYEWLGIADHLGGGGGQPCFKELPPQFDQPVCP